jgi:hypothetical protein
MLCHFVIQVKTIVVFPMCIVPTIIRDLQWSSDQCCLSRWISEGDSRACAVHICRLKLKRKIKAAGGKARDSWNVLEGGYRVSSRTHPPGGRRDLLHLLAPFI